MIWVMEREKSVQSCSIKVLKRQDLACTHLAHHELESVSLVIVVIIIVIVVVVILILIILIIVQCCVSPAAAESDAFDPLGGHQRLETAGSVPGPKTCGLCPVAG